MIAIFIFIIALFFFIKSFIEYRKFRYIDKYIKRFILATIVLIVSFVYFEVSLSNQPEENTIQIKEYALSEEEYRAECQEYNFKDVLRNPENYVGQKIKIRIKISSVKETNLFNTTKYYFGYTESKYGWLGDMYAVFDNRHDDSLKLLSDDIIDVYGEISNPEHTKSLFLNSEEVFVINMKYVDLIAE